MSADYYDPANNNYKIGDIVGFNKTYFEGDMASCGYGIVVESPRPPRPRPHPRPRPSQLRPRPFRRLHRRQDNNFYYTTIFWFDTRDLRDDWEGFFSKVEN